MLLLFFVVVAFFVAVVVVVAIVVVLLSFFLFGPTLYPLSYPAQKRPIDPLKILLTHGHTDLSTNTDTRTDPFIPKIPIDSRTDQLTHEITDPERIH